MTTATQTTLRAFIRRHGITAEAELVETNPNLDDPTGWEGATHWKVTLRSAARRRMTVYFSQGAAICREPEAEDILDCLASDAASSGSARTFEEWADDYGFDTDSRRAYRTWRTTVLQAARLEQFLGADAYETLLYHCERL